MAQNDDYGYIGKLIAALQAQQSQTGAGTTQAMNQSPWMQTLQQQMTTAPGDPGMAVNNPLATFGKKKPANPQQMTPPVPAPVQKPSYTPAQLRQMGAVPLPNSTMQTPPAPQGSPQANTLPLLLKILGGQ